MRGGEKRSLLNGFESMEAIIMEDLYHLSTHV